MDWILLMTPLLPFNPHVLHTWGFLVPGQFVLLCRTLQGHPTDTCGFARNIKTWDWNAWFGVNSTVRRLILLPDLQKAEVCPSNPRKCFCSKSVSVHVLPASPTEEHKSPFLPKPPWRFVPVPAQRISMASTDTKNVTSIHPLDNNCALIYSISIYSYKVVAFFLSRKQRVLEFLLLHCCVPDSAAAKQQQRWCYFPSMSPSLHVPAGNWLTLGGRTGNGVNGIW